VITGPSSFLFVTYFCTPGPVIFQGYGPALVTAFSTSSSAASLPVGIESKALGVHPSIVGFVMPLGATINQNGTALANRWLRSSLRPGIPMTLENS
jgi:Na+/H+-dicarboxylate symporter